eukprot:TRINITY_DN10475_c0_g1_i1.p1 TRINITY_DN10475_c0_g1~~TRINITY_DN10475_c0_g1_i1.p1  ORF type:complete len:585 (+),score=99.94 TRINITY_DN10475_c0_g1_i1:195-1949(+)
MDSTCLSNSIAFLPFRYNTEKMLVGVMQHDRSGIFSKRFSSIETKYMLKDNIKALDTLHILRKSSFSSKSIRYIQCSNKHVKAHSHTYCKMYSEDYQSSKSTVCPMRYFDFIVIGSGIAGLRYALEVAKHGSVAIITKSESHESNTNYAQGGVSAVLSPSDSVESHVKDTIIAGAYLCDEKTVKVVRFLSSITFLASGGAGHIYPTTTNPLVATGDGIAMAYRAHAVISNMEFVQFHPTALADEGLPIKPPPRENTFLITEAVRGSGGILYNQSMDRFMPSYDPRAELAPRDVVARSIDDQLKTRNERYVLLDISHRPKDEILSHFPNIAAECLNYGLDMTRSPIPVVPAAHYICGGVKAGISGETSIEGLYAAGEVACTGLHGANRLASNSLLEALVFAHRAVGPSVEYKTKSKYDVNKSVEWPFPVIPLKFDASKLSEIKRLTARTRIKLQKIMWNYVGIVRSAARLKMSEKLLEELELEWEDDLSHLGWRPCMANLQVCEMRNLFCCARLVVSSAISRNESRGLHYVVDFPSQVESQRMPTILYPSSQLRSSWSNCRIHKHISDADFSYDDPEECKEGALV